MILALLKGMKARRQNRGEFSAGMKVPESGIYQARHDCAPPRDMVLIAGKTFPSCPNCDGLKFERVRTAAYIHDDADFQSQKK